MPSVDQTSPASAAVSEAGDRPSDTTTCVECWHLISRHDVVSGVVIDSPTRPGRTVVFGFVHVECGPRFETRQSAKQTGSRLVPLV